MNAKHFFRTACVAGAGPVIVVLLTACSTAGYGGPAADAANYGLSVAAEARLPRAQQDVAACLRQRANSPSYPQGVSPGYTSTVVDDGVMRLTQLLYLKRGMTSATN